jgi:hypothetical protein
VRKINWTHRVRNEKVLYTAKKDSSILHTIKSRKANWACLLKHIIEGRMKMRDRSDRKTRKKT